MKWRVDLAAAVAQAEKLLRAGGVHGSVVGVDLDIVSRASAVLRKAIDATKAPEKAAQAAGEKARELIRDAAKTAVEEARKVKDAALGGLEDLVRDATKAVAGPALTLFLLWLAWKEGLLSW